MAFLGSEQTNQDAVYAKVSELCEKEIGMKFEPLMLSFGDYQDKLNLMLSGGDKLDILPMTSSMASSYINAKQIADLSQYIDEYGKDIISQMGETVAKSGAVNGFIYGIPSNKESASKAGIVMRKDIVDELGIDVDSLKTLDDLTAVFAKVKAAHPELDVVSGTNMVSQIQEWDPLTDSFGVLMDEGQSTKVVNLFETDLYKTRVNRVFNWYQAGYVKLDAATTTDTSSNLVKAGSLFSYFAPIKPGYLTQASASDGREMVYAYIGKDDGTVSNMIGSANVNFFDWGIAQQSEDKVKAMQFLDFAYSSADFNNLMNFGIEGEDYEKVSGSNVLIDYPSGKDATSVYHLNMGWHLPNQFVGYVWNGNPEDIWQQYKDFNASATYSKAFGFFYDSSTVSTQVTALSSVLTEYQKPLETGSVSDVESTLKDLNDKLYAAGLQEVMDLKQTQLDKWLSENTSK
jgi:putative aldouronate transport system substrate-binding protein